MTIMDKNHPLWEEFCERLEFAVFNHRGESMCDHNTEITKYVLNQFDGIDTKASLENFINLGGFCDCEIVYTIIDEA